MVNRGCCDDRHPSESSLSSGTPGGSYPYGCGFVAGSDRSPMGNLKERPEWLITPSEVDDIIDFCYDTMKDGRIRIYPADCIGYFNKQEQEVRRVSYQTTNTEWDGCNAGTAVSEFSRTVMSWAVLLSVRVNLSRVTFATQPV